VIAQGLLFKGKLGIHPTKGQVKHSPSTEVASGVRRLGKGWEKVVGDRDKVQDVSWLGKALQRLTLRWEPKERDGEREGKDTGVLIMLTEESSSLR